MTKQSKAKMFLADERGFNENEWFRSCTTFNFGKYFNEHKQGVGNIYVFNDDTLDGGRSLSMFMEEYSYVILLPVVGAVAYKDSMGNENLVAAGQVQVANIPKGVTMSFTNPFKNELVNFLQVWIKGGEENLPVQNILSTYDVNVFVNNLVDISPQRISETKLPFVLSIGKFSGRGETIYKLKNIIANAFVFVIEGAFEVVGRLLHARDGLAIWESSDIEMEALSNDAILLVIAF